VLVTADLVVVEITELASALGVGETALHRSIKRLVEFQLAEWNGDVLFVLTRIPVVSHRMLETLTSPARRFHAAALAASLQAPRP
jgi:predicted transcriptional regulator